MTMPRAVWLWCACLLAAPLACAENAPPTITAGGQAEIRVDADSARFNATVVTTAKEVSQALEENNQRVQRVLAALKDVRGTKAGADTRIESGRFSVRPVFTQRPPRPDPDWQPDIVGYSVRNQVRVWTRTLNHLGALIGAANAAGANAIDGLTFELEDPSEYRTRAIKEATRRALADAGAAAEAAKVKLAKIERIEVQPEPRVRPLRMNAALSRGVEIGGAAVPVEPGEVSVHASVLVTMEIEP